MKKIVSLVLVLLVVVSMIPTVLANETDYKNGTKVTYSAPGNETYTVTVPAELAPGGSGEVTLSGTWATNRVVKVVAAQTVTLTNDIDPSEQRVLDVKFDGIQEAGSNAVSQTFTQPISVGDIEDALFGVWSGKFYYTVTVDDNENGAETPESPEPTDPTPTDPTPDPEPEPDPTPTVPSDVAYYSSLNVAITDETLTGDSDEVSGVAMAFMDANTGLRTVRLLNNTTIDETINVSSDVVLVLNGHKIETEITPAIRVQGGNMAIDGTKDGSAMICNAPTTKKGTILSVMEGSLDVNGGVYTSNTSGAGTSTSQTQVLYAYNDTTLNVNDAIITAIDTNNGSVIGVTGKSGSALTLTNCDVLVRSGTSLENVGVRAEGSAVLTNCEIIAEANYTANAAGNNYASNSRGVHSFGSLEMYDCYVWGAHAGVTTQGSLYIDGGTYEGFGHGGLYIAGSSTTNYIYNATLNWAPMREGLTSDAVAGTNGAALYVGGGSNITTYIDNCDFNTLDATGHTYKNNPLAFYAVVLRDSGGEKNNTVYISNSTVLDAKTQAFRIGNTMKVYSGVGNNYDGAAIVHKVTSDQFITTTESYAPTP